MKRLFLKEQQIMKNMFGQILMQLSHQVMLCLLILLCNNTAKINFSVVPYWVQIIKML